MTPKRIQRQRTKGWRMPEGARYVGRPTFYGNPFTVGLLVRPYMPETGHVRDREHATELYRDWLRKPSAYGWDLNRKRNAIIDHLYSELRGWDLACWCPLTDKHGNAVPCHADVLLELANREVSA